MSMTSSIYSAEEKWEITKRFRDISPEEKELFLKGVIKDLENAKVLAKEELKESATNQTRKVVNGITAGSLGVAVVGFGAAIAGKMLGAPVEFVVASFVPLVIGSAAGLAGVVTSPFVSYSDGVEKVSKKKMKKADEGIRQAKEELKKTGRKGR